VFKVLLKILQPLPFLTKIMLKQLVIRCYMPATCRCHTSDRLPITFVWQIYCITHKQKYRAATTKQNLSSILTYEIERNWETKSSINPEKTLKTSKTNQWTNVLLNNNQRILPNVQLTTIYNYYDCWTRKEKSLNTSQDLLVVINQSLVHKFI